MILIKSFLIAVLITIGSISTYTDFKTGKIPNKLIFCGLIASIIGNILYFYIDSINIVPFAFNLLFSLGIAITMYALHIWAGGDVKLFVLCSALIPECYLKQYPPLPIIKILTYIFSIAFVFLIVESIIMSIHHKTKTEKLKFHFSIKRILSCFVSVYSIQTILRVVFGTLYIKYLPIFLMLNVIIVLEYNKLSFLNSYISIAICSIISVVGLAFSISDGNTSIDIKNLVVSVFVVIIRYFCSQYNYKTIPTSEVKKGMVLSLGTTLMFQKSRVKGLPCYSTEDISSRITQDEADSVLRWSKTKNGQDTVVIVRKIPFAIFIFLGYTFYLLLGIIIW